MTFEDRLLTELRAVVAENPAPRPRHRRRLALPAAGLTTAAGVAAVVIAGGGASADPAYAVSKQADGAVEVTVSSLKDAEGLQDKLRAAGIPADVSYVENPPCSDSLPTPGLHTAVRDAGPGVRTAGAPPAGEPAGPMITSSVQSDGAATFVIDPATIQPGDRLTIRASVGHLNSLTMGIGHGDQPLPPLPCP